MTPIFAQAAAAANPATNASGRVLDSNNDIVARFEQATGMPREVAIWSVNILASVIILIAGFILAGFLRSLVRRVFTQRKIDPTIAGFAGNITHAAIMAFVVVTALGQLGVDTKSFAAIIAAAGLAIGLALQGSLSNFAAGVLIIVFRPFKAGDVVNGAGIEGTIEEVQVFSTTLNTADNKRIMVPNSSLMTGPITNYTANPSRRVDVQCSIGVGQDLVKAHEAVLSVARADSRVLKNPETTVANTKFVDGGTQIELRAWCKTGDYGGVLSDLLARIPPALAAVGVKGPDKTLYYVERKV
jgi:small conductance mechanosensitive channel